MKITSLTEEQTAQFGKYRDEGLSVGLSTTPASKEEIEEAVNLAYKCADLEPPKQFVHLASPIAAWLYFFDSALQDEFQKLLSSSVPGIEAAFAA